jgi:hypothetical protein
MVSKIPIDVYRLFKKLDTNIKFSNIKMICNEKYISENNSLVYKAGKYVIKPESNFFITKYYPQIKKLYSIDKNYILNYKNNLNINPNLFFYEYIPGYLLCSYPYKNNKNVIENLIKFIKFYINIDKNKFNNIITKELKRRTTPYIEGIENKTATNNPLYKDLKQIYDICLKNQKKSKRKLLLVKDLSAHNIIVDKNNKIKLIDMSDGVIVDYFHLYIHRYFSFLWIFGEKAVDKAIDECNIDNNFFVKELSLIYFLYEKIPTNCHNWYKRLLFKYQYRKICKKIIKSLNKRYSD